MKSSYYFPHDYHSRHDPKLEKLRMEIGPVGDGIYWDLVEMLYEEGGYLPLSDCQLIAKSLNTTEELVIKVVKNAKLFLIKDEKFYSKSLLDRLNHIRTKIRKARVSGRLGGLAKAKQSLSERLVSKESKESKESKYRDVPPLLQDVINYCSERKNGVDPQKWYNHYQSKGWLIGKNKMKDWQASVRTWEESKPERKMNIL
jgi:hypothetical protein